MSRIDELKAKIAKIEDRLEDIECEREDLDAESRRLELQLDDLECDLEDEEEYQAEQDARAAAGRALDSKDALQLPLLPE